MPSIKVHVSLYGDLAQYAGGRHVAQTEIMLNSSQKIGDLLDILAISTDKKGYIFKNAVLCDVPGLDAARDEPLCDGDHLGLFSRRHMWPYQYRDGIRMSDNLARALRKSGAVHNIYKPAED